MPKNLIWHCLSRQCALGSSATSRRERLVARYSILNNFKEHMMKKKIRRLKLERETIRQLTPERLEQAVGAGDPPDSRILLPTLVPSCIPSQKCL